MHALPRGANYLIYKKAPTSPFESQPIIRCGMLTPAFFLNSPRHSRLISELLHAAQLAVCHPVIATIVAMLLGDLP